MSLLQCGHVSDSCRRCDVLRGRRRLVREAVSAGPGVFDTVIFPCGPTCACLPVRPWFIRFCLLCLSTLLLRIRCSCLILENRKVGLHVNNGQSLGGGGLAVDSAGSDRWFLCLVGQYSAWDLGVVIASPHLVVQECVTDLAIVWVDIESCVCQYYSIVKILAIWFSVVNMLFVVRRISSFDNA